VEKENGEKIYGAVSDPRGVTATGRNRDAPFLSFSILRPRLIEFTPEERDNTAIIAPAYSRAAHKGRACPSLPTRRSIGKNSTGRHAAAGEGGAGGRGRGGEG